MPEDEIETLRRRISLLPESHPLRQEAITRLQALERQRAEERREELRGRLQRLAGEVEHLRHEFGIDLQEIRVHIVKLTEAVEKRVRPEEVAEVGRMVADMQMFLSGLMLPWQKKITEERSVRELWRDRIKMGEAELVNEILGKYALYRSYHHLPSCQTWVETTPLPYK